MLTGRLLAAHVLRLLARHRRLLACWLLLLPLLSLALLPPDPGQPWLPRQLLSCSRPRPGSRPDIDAELIWPTLDFVANDTKARPFWSDKLEAQYQKVKMQPTFPLKILLVPHSGREHDWRTPLTDLYRTTGRASLDALVKVMPDLPDMTFTWSEVSQLHLWWYGASEESRQVLAGLIRSGRLEVTSGSWVVPEDTAARLPTLVQQLVEGHQWLRQHVGVTPETGLCSGLPGAGCSSTLAYLFSQAGLRQTIVTSAPRAWTDFLATRRSIDFLWQQQWIDGGPETMLTHMHPTDRSSDEVDCGPAEDNPDLCSGTDLCQSLLAASGYDDLFTDISADTVKDRAEALVAAAGRVASLTTHNVALVMVPADFHPANTSAWRERHRSNSELSRYISAHSESLAATVEVATPARYFEAVRQRTAEAAAPLARLGGDLHGSPGGGPPAEQGRWRRTMRRLETRLRDVELLLVWALGVHQRQLPSDADRALVQASQKLANGRRTAALLSRRGATVGGVRRALAKELAATNKALTRITHLLLSALLLDLGRFSSTVEATKHYMSLHDGLDPAPRLASISVHPGDAHQLVIYNSLPFERSEVIRFVTHTPNIAVQESSGADVPLELSSYRRGAFVVKFLASRLAPVSMTMYRVSSTDLGSAADPSLTFDQTESDISGALNISNERFELQLTESPHSWLLVDRRSGDELPLEIRLTSLQSTGDSGPTHEPLPCLEEGWSRHADSVTAEATLRCGRLRLTLRLTHATGAIGQAVTLLVESESSGNGGVSDASNSVLSILAGGSGEETESGPLLLQLRTPVQSQTDDGGFFADSGDYQMVRRAPARLPRGLRPATAQVSLQDERRRLSVLLEQTRSVASPAEGELAVLIGDLGETVYAELLLVPERLPVRPAARRELFANSPLVALLSQQLVSPASPLFSSSGSPVRVRTTPRLLSGPLPCDYDLISLRQLETSAGGQPAARALLTLSRRRLDCRLWDSRDELGCRLEYPLPALSKLVGVEKLQAVSLTGEEEPGAPPLAGLQEVRLKTDQVRSFVITLDRELPQVKTQPQPAVADRGKRNRPVPASGRPFRAGADEQFEVGQSYHLQL